MTSKGVLAFPFLLTLILISATSSANEAHCIDALDIVQVQDMTASFDSLWPQMEKQVDSIMESIVETGLDSHFGLATFGDKNLSGHNLKSGKGTSLGYPKDYCLHVDVALQQPNTKDIVGVFEEYRERAVSGGGDWSEGVFEALYRALISPKLGWREQTSKGKKVARVAVVVTDALSHVEGDVRALTGKTVRPFDITAEGIKKHKNDENYDCDKVDYPTVKQVVDLVKELDVYVVLLVAPGGTFDNEKFRAAASLAKQGKQYRGVDGLKLWYEHQFANAGFENVLAVQLDSKMHVYGKAFKKALDEFNFVRCPKSTTTTTTTTTSTTTTAPTTTTSTHHHHERNGRDIWGEDYEGEDEDYRMLKAKKSKTTTTTTTPTTTTSTTPTTTTSTHHHHERNGRHIWGEDYEGEDEDYRMLKAKKSKTTSTTTTTPTTTTSTYNRHKEDDWGIWVGDYEREGEDYEREDED